jgi:hypothetical protein
MSNAIKSKALATQTPEAKVEATSFLAQLSTLAKPVVKAEASKADPLVGMRSKFAINADEALKAIKDKAAKSRWHSTTPGGQLLVCFRNANSVMKLGDHTHFQVADADAAVKLIEGAKAAAKSGELDAALKATARAPKSKATTA